MAVENRHVRIRASVEVEKGTRSNEVAVSVAQRKEDEGVPIYGLCFVDLELADSREYEEEHAGDDGDDENTCGKLACEVFAQLAFFSVHKERYESNTGKGGMERENQNPRLLSRH